MLSKKLLLSAAILGFLSTSQVEAKNQRSIGEIFKECGIGAAIFKDNGTAATISNIIWDLGTTATFSALSSPETCEGKKAKVAMLIGRSYDQLETELAEGKGEYLDTLSSLSGKSTETLRKSFAKEASKASFQHKDKLAKAQVLFDIASK